MKKANQSICIIDDDQEVCTALRWLFESMHFTVETCNSAEQFLNESRGKKHGCLLIDVRMPDMSGLELLEHLKVRRMRPPVIMLTGHGDIPMAVRAMKAGAVDFCLKPFNDQCLLELVQRCIAQSSSDVSNSIHERLNTLSARERQIIDLIMEGKLNKEIAYELFISISTVEAHRAKIMDKMNAKNLAQLARAYLQTFN